MNGQKREVNVVFIPPFLCGVAVTIAVEIVGIIIVVICEGKK